MFSGLLTELRADISATELVLSTHERFRDLILTGGPQQTQGESVEVTTRPSVDCIDAFSKHVGALPSRLDWQIYDHSAAVTRLYAAYERFVNDLVSAYVGMLPELYQNASDLPETIVINHRIGIGQILVKIGARKQYKDVQEAAAIRALSAGLGGGTHYNLIPEAFLVDRLNYRMETLAKIFGSLEFEEPAKQISNHPAVVEFMKTTRGESDTPQAELDGFVKYRNEAAHGIPEQILSPDEIKKMGQFLNALGKAIADMVNESVVKRHLHLGNSFTVATISEIHHDGTVVVAILRNESVAVGDELFVYDDRICRRAKVESLQVNDTDVMSVEGNAGREVGIRLSVRARHGADLRRLRLPDRVVPTQLAFEDIPASDVHVEAGAPSDEGGSADDSSTDSESQ